jgi:hypothetical protein
MSLFNFTNKNNLNMLNIFLYKLKIVYLSIQNKLPIILGKIFTKSNLNKVIIIFIVGFISRIFIVNIYNVNVYYEYMNIISILYYTCMSFFIVVVHELVNYFEFNIIPPFLIELSTFFINIFRNIKNFGYYISKTLNYTNNLIFSIKLSDYKVSSIREGFRLYLNKEKLSMDVDVCDNKENIEKISSNINDNVLQKNNHKSSRGNKHNNIDKGNSSSSNSTINNRPRSNNLPFLVDTIRDSSDLNTDRPVLSPEPLTNRVYDPSSNNTIPNAPNLNSSRLTTPSISTIKTTDTPRFNSLTSSIHPGSDNNSQVAGTPNNNYTYTPVPNYSPVTANYVHGYPVPGEVPYFSPARVSSDTTHATIGLNGSNENI